MKERFDRNERFFGKEGQAKLSASRVAMIGVGGLGTHVAQQLALLGVGRLALVDSEELEESNLNRYIGVHYDDPIPGTPKVDIGERLIKSIDPNIEVVKIHDSFVSDRAYNEFGNSDVVFGCLDSEGARLVLTEVCAVYDHPYFDLATEIQPGKHVTYGGRVCIAKEGDGCIVCLGVIDLQESQIDLAGPEAKRNRAALYGVDPDALDERGPSVVSINGVIASLGVTEFTVMTTGLRSPKRLLTYHGHTGKVMVSIDEPASDCYYCKGVRVRHDTSNIREYIKTIGSFLR